MKLSPAKEKFILHWGEMGTKWGINRTVAQVHALLHVSAKPLDAEEIVETLGVARSNVSTSLKELQGWGIVKVVHVMGDRRDHFESMRDVWTLFQIIMDERKKREIDPTVAVLRECVKEAKGEGDAVAYERLKEMGEFVETMSGWYGQVRKLPASGWRKMARMGGVIGRLVGG
jgi:DNA-binding transcriptional regulator GbsR (MarR family)